MPSFQMISSDSPAFQEMQMICQIVTNELQPCRFFIHIIRPHPELNTGFTYSTIFLTVVY